jgi:2-iminobutanoate/2-iminopropanoate deaminase
MGKVIKTDVAPGAIGPYSQAITAGGFVFTAGQIGLDPASGELVAGVANQTQRAMQNLREVLSAAGADFGDVVKTTIYLIDLNDFSEVNNVYAAYFKDGPPARSTVQVAALPKGALVEIDMIATIGER